VKIIKRSPLLLVMAALALVLLTQSYSGASASVEFLQPYAQNRSSLAEIPDPPPGSLVADPAVWVVRAYFSDPAMVTLVSPRWEPWEVNYEEGYLVVEVDQAGMQYLQAAGFRVEIDEKLTYLVNRPAVLLPDQTEGIPSYACYRTVEETFLTAEEIVAAYPNLAAWLDIGDSWEKITPGGSAGYDMWVLRLTNSLTSGSKPKLFVMSSLHAREYAPAELSTRFAEYLVSHYDSDPDVTYLLDYFEIHLLLMANPDGRKKAESGLYWRKNTNNNFCSNTNNRGIDLNRNFDFAWGCCSGSSGYACDETYRGPAPASEPEVLAIQNYVSSIFSDWRADDLNSPASADAAGVFLDVHSFGKLVLWPWGFTTSLAPNSTALQTLGRKFAYFNAYTPEQSIFLYPTDGTTDDFAYGELGLPAYTFELGTSFFQDCSSFKNIILPANLPALLYAAKAAQAPYQIPAGPDAGGIQVLPPSVGLGQSVLVQASLDDRRVSGSEPTQNISSAEFSIDLPPWVSGAITHTLGAADGAFDAKIETVQAFLDTTGLTHGRHTVFVRGRDTSGSYGPVSAHFFYVLDPAIAPYLYGYTRDASSNSPLNAFVQAGDFTTRTDPLSGFYEVYLLEGEYTLTATAPDYAPEIVSGALLENGQSIRQDFYLLPACALFDDDVESGAGSWSADGSWAISTESANSPTHAWSDSPGAPYGSKLNVSLTSPPLDLTAAGSTQLSFWHTYDLENGYDYGFVEYSTDGGNSWETAGTYNGAGQTTWSQVTLPLPALDGAANARIRFRLYSDETVSADGWHVDDIQVIAGHPSCFTPLAPAANFTSTSPVFAGQPLQFTNLSTGTNPLAYYWDFGDNAGTSIDFEPVYAYPLPGTYTVTLTVSNTLGSAAYQQPVQIDLFLPTSFVYLGEIYFTAPSR
jgi:carboxypeptidase T